MDWASGLIWKVTVPVVSFMLAGAVSWGVMSARMDNVEQSILRIENNVDWIMRFFAQGPMQ